MIRGRNKCHLASSTFILMIVLPYRSPLPLRFEERTAGDEQLACHILTSRA